MKKHNYFVLLPILYMLLAISCNKGIEDALNPTGYDNKLTLEEVTSSPMFVNINQASKIAPKVSRFYVRNSNGKMLTKSIIQKSILKRSTNAKDEIPFFYIFNFKEGEWAIISADRRTMPIMAYSETGSFNEKEKPIGLVLWEDATRQVITDLRQSNTALTNNAIISEWSSL